MPPEKRKREDEVVPYDDPDADENYQIAWRVLNLYLRSLKPPMEPEMAKSFAMIHCCPLITWEEGQVNPLNEYVSVWVGKKLIDEIIKKFVPPSEKKEFYLDYFRYESSGFWGRIFSNRGVENLIKRWNGLFAPCKQAFYHFNDDKSLLEHPEHYAKFKMCGYNIKPEWWEIMSLDRTKDVAKVADVRASDNIPLFIILGKTKAIELSKDGVIIEDLYRVSVHQKRARLLSPARRQSFCDLS